MDSKTKTYKLCTASRKYIHNSIAGIPQTKKGSIPMLCNFSLAPNNELLYL